MLSTEINAAAAANDVKLRYNSCTMNEAAIEIKTVRRRKTVNVYTTVVSEQNKNSSTQLYKYAMRVTIVVF